MLTLNKTAHECGRSQHSYTCDTLEDMVNALRSKSIASSVVVTYKTCNLRVLSRHNNNCVHIHGNTKLPFVIKIKHVDVDLTPLETAGNIAISTKLNALMQRNKGAAHTVVSHLDIIPGYVTVMERCTTNAWKAKHIKGEQSMIRYLLFGVNALANLAREGFEARDYKAENVGVRRNSPHGKYCILDTSQIMHIEESQTAVCTYPACGSWTYGSTDSYIGLAATAWAYVADAFVMCGHDARELSHLKVTLTPSSTPPSAYCAPAKKTAMLAWIEAENMHEKAPYVAHALQSAVTLYTKCFPAARAIASLSEAAKDAETFYSALAAILNKAMRRCAKDDPCFLYD